MKLGSFSSVLVLLASVLLLESSPLAAHHTSPSTAASRAAQTRRRLPGQSTAAGFRPGARQVRSASFPMANFATAVSYNSGGYLSQALAVGDVNGDGKPDLLAANWCSGSDEAGCVGNGAVGVLLNNGDGTFQAPVTYDSAGNNTTSMAVADVNGDLKPDLLVANNCIDSSNCDNGIIAVLLNNGDGTFQAALPCGAGGYQPHAVAVADINGDGNPDLLVANNCGSSGACAEGGLVGVLLGNGDGTFQAAITYGSGGYGADSVVVGDVNGDGRPDLLVASNCVDSSNCENGTVGVLLGNGDGTFQAAVTYGSGGYQANSVAIGDVNGDGRPDLLVTNRCLDSSNCENGTVGALLGNGDGTFQVAVAYSSGGHDAASVAIGEVNGDGLLDLLVANQCASSTTCANGGTVAVLLGSGDGTFQLAVPYGSRGNQSAAVAVGDLNADGKPDVIVANQCFDTSCAGGSVSVLLNITPKVSTTTLISSLNPSTFGQTVTFAATVAPSATGTITFTDGTNTLGTAPLANGTATLTTSALAAGTHSITAAYSGDANFTASSSSALPQTVQPAPSTIGVFSSLSPSIFGQSVTLSATVTPQNGGSAGGTVTFYDGTTVLSSVQMSGNSAALTISSLAAGTHPLTAAYSGDSNVNASTSSVVSQAVNPAATSTSVSPSQNPAFLTIPVTFTATVTGQFGGATSGSVTFYSGTTVLGTSTVSSGRATLAHTYTATGTLSITASYGGDTNNASSTSPVLSESVTRIPTTATIRSGLNPSTYGQTVVFTGTIDFTPGNPPSNETVNFKEITKSGSEILLGTSPLVGSTAVFSVSSLAIGTHNIKVQYVGDKYFFNCHSATVAQVVNKPGTSTSLGSSLNPSTYGQSITFTAIVVTSGPVAPTGKVTFKRGTTTLGSTTLSGSTATLTTSTLNSGNASVTATYAGDSFNATSTSPGLVEVVNKAPTSTVLISSQNPSSKGQAVTFTATLSSTTGPVPTGTVTFKTGTTTLCSATLTGGVATCTVSTLSHGTHTVIANYPATANFLGSSASLVQTVN